MHCGKLWLRGLATLALIVLACAPACGQSLPSDFTAPAVPWSKAAITEDPSTFRFAIVSDRYSGARAGVFESALDKLTLLQPDFVMSIGDLVGPIYNRQQLIDQHEEVDRLVGALSMPFFYVCGNHEIPNDMAAEVWRQRYGRPYYHFTYKGVLFVVLCNVGKPAATLDESQVDYVRAALEANRDARWTFLFMHVPTLGPDSQVTNPLWGKIEELLAGRRWTAFAGHHHQYSIHDRDGHKYIQLATTGGGSELLGLDFGQFDHIVWVTMTPQGPQVANLMLEGIQDQSVTTPAMVAESHRLLGGVSVICEPVYDSPDLPWPRTAKLTFANTANLPATVSAIVRPNRDWSASPTSLELQLDPSSTKLVELSLSRAEGLAGPPRPMTFGYMVAYVTAGGRERRFEYAQAIGLAQLLPCRPARRPITLDGNLADWPELPVQVDQPGQVLEDHGRYAGSDDCRFRLATAYDQQCVYVAVDVTDDVVYVPPPGGAGRSDFVRIYLSAVPDAEHQQQLGGPGTIRATATLRSPAASSPASTPAGRPATVATSKADEPICATVQRDGGYTAEFAVPVSLLEQAAGGPWRQFRLNVVVEDRSAADRWTDLWWHPAWDSPQSYSGTGMFQRQP